MEKAELVIMGLTVVTVAVMAMVSLDKNRCLGPQIPGMNNSVPAYVLRWTLNESISAPYELSLTEAGQDALLTWRANQTEHLAIEGQNHCYEVDYLLPGDKRLERPRRILGTVRADPTKELYELLIPEALHENITEYSVHLEVCQFSQGIMLAGPEARLAVIVNGG